MSNQSLWSWMAALRRAGLSDTLSLRHSSSVSHPEKCLPLFPYFVTFI